MKNPEISTVNTPPAPHETRPVDFDPRSLGALGSTALGLLEIDGTIAREEAVELATEETV